MKPCWWSAAAEWGLAAINAAKIAGAAKIIAADPLPEKRELAKVLGATHTVDALAEDAAGQIIAISGGGVDWGIEAVGRQASARSGSRFAEARRNRGDPRHECPSIARSGSARWTCSVARS